MSATRKITPRDHHTTNVVATPFGVAVEAGVDTKRSVGRRFAEPKARRDGRRRHSGSARLGNRTSNVSAPVSADWFDERDDRFRDREVNAYLFGGKDRSASLGRSQMSRLAKCGKVPISKVGNTAGKVSPAGVAHVAGYQTCGSIWACPPCAAKIRQHRGEQIAEAVRTHLEGGGQVFMTTLTVPHDLGMGLKESFTMVSEAWNACITGRASKPFRENIGFVGYIRAFDLTYGWENGWHPHIHALIFVDSKGDQSPASTFLLEEMIETHYRTKWDSYLVRKGYRSTAQQGIRVDAVKDEKGIGKYVSKVSFELTRSDKKKAKKGNFNQWQLLRYGRETGDAQCFALWKEYVEVSKGRKCITWSVGLKKQLLGIEEEEDQTDEEVAAQATADLPLIYFGPLLSRVLGQVMPKIAIMRALERNGADGARYCLTEVLGLEVRTSWVEQPRGDPPDGELFSNAELSKVPLVELSA